MLNQQSRINKIDERYDTFGMDDNFLVERKVHIQWNTL